MSSPVHMMVDLESFGNDGICQIGAVKWNIDNGEIKSKFLVNTIPDLERTPANYDTLRWWFSQSREAQASLFSDPEPISLEEGLKALTSWYHNGSKANGVWSHATFDVPALQNNYTMYGMRPPWPYRSAKDIRTLNWMAISLGRSYLKEQFVKATLDHNALADSIEQAKNVTIVWNWIKDNHAKALHSMQEESADSAG